MRWLGILLAALALLAGCKQPATTPSPTPAPLASTLRKHRLHTPTPSPAPTRTASPTSAPTASPVALPTFAPTPAPTASPAPVLTAAPLLTPPPTAAPTPTDPPPVGNAASGSFTGNGSTGGTVGAVTATPSPTPTPVPTPPSLPPTLVYGDGTNNDNKTTTLLQVQQLLHFCEGLGASQYNSASAFSIDQCPGGGFAYMSYTMLEPHTNGGSAPAPYGGNYANGSSGGGAGTCPSPWNAANPFAATTGTALLNFTSTSSTTNVLNYANGTSIGSDGNAIFGFGSPDLRLFPNLTSTTLQSVTNQILQNCAFAGQGGTKILAFDKVQGMSDNTAGGLLSQHGGLWDGHTSEHYPTDVNCCGGTAPYTSSSGIGTPATYFNGIQHTQGSPINSNCGSAAGDFTCETPTYPGDSDYTNGIVTFLDALQHRNGTPYMSIVNGMFGGYDACTISAAPNVLAGVKEFAYLGPAENGVPQSDLLLRQLVDVASQNQACGGKMFLLLDYLNSSQYNSQGVGTSAPGTPAYEMQMRGHFGFEWAFYDDAHPNMMGSWLQGCVEGCSQAEWSDIYGANFATMNGAVTPYFTKAVGASNQLCGENFYYFVHTGCAITAGGMLDQQNTVSASGGTCAGGSEACVVRRIFAHAFFWNSGACATYDQRNWNATCWHDIGPVVILANLTGGNITLSQNFLNAALTYGGTNYYPLVHDILEPGCQGLASLYGNTAGSPLYPADGLEGTATTAIGCTANTYWDAVNGSHPGGYALSNETSIGTSTGPTLHDTGVVMFSAAAP